jgi:hypothetical protein
MATSVIALSGTITAGTPKASPLTVALPVGTNLIDTIRWRVPPGPRGNLGWFLSMGGVQVLPEISGEYIVADNEYDEWSIAGLPDSGAWQVTGYNTGTYDHTVYFQFHVTPVQLGATLTANIDAGFPTSEEQIPTMWLNPVNPFAQPV